MTSPQAISAPLAEFVVNTTYRCLPQRTVYMAKRCLLDAIGVSLAASGLGEGCRAFVDIALEQGGHPNCTIFGETKKVPVVAAAFANGSMAHAMDYEDAHDVTLLHPNAAAVPAALAIAEAFGPVSGEDLIAAIAVGCDVAVRMGLALKVGLADYGWYPPPILASFGATAAAAKLLHLNAQQVRDAFSLTLCQATCSGEIIYSPDSVVRAVRDAFATRTAVTSALLAARGVSGFDLPLEGRAGFYAMFARGAYDPAILLHELGNAFEIENISFKPWPSCRGTHAAIEALIDLRTQHALDPSQVKSIELRGGDIMRMLNQPLETKRRPSTAIDAKFSLPFTAATALVLGRVTLAEFLPAALTDERVRQVAGRVSFDIDAQAPANGIGCGVTVTTVAGARFHARVDAPLGNPGNPMTEAAFIDKFLDCARYAARPIDAAGAARICEAVLDLDALDDVGSQLMPLLRAQEAAGE
jgi:2-methylcitrate dehydratase PrpD